ncbi:MAG: helicase-related protein [Pseudomonadota bacterium]
MSSTTASFTDNSFASAGPDTGGFHGRAMGTEKPVTAVLGPTNTGKTHYAIERMLAYKSGMIGFPLRLLAREVYDKLVARRSAQEIALVTGEEKIIPRSPRYWVCTVEAMPLSERTEFLAIDEIQLAAHQERGRTFTSRLLYARGAAETLFLGSDTMAPILRRLFPHINFIGRERFSTLSFAGAKKVTRLPRRSAIVGFSADTVYAIAELVRRQRGGAAVVLGALSPRTRNAQAELYQNGEVDYLIATDAIGMGLNMDIDHVAFAARRKFDGRQMRDLTASEAAQIAGRAGRHMRDGTFGITADCRDFDEPMVEAIEEHRFDAVSALFWRAEALDFSSIPALQHSLDSPAPRDELLRARPDDDERVFTQLIKQDTIRHYATGGAALAQLWDVCQLPDFRKVTLDQHTRLVGDIYEELMAHERISEEWLAPRVAPLDRADGDIDALSSRIAHIRSWTYLANRGAWLENASYWQDQTRAIEDRLSDALHERLTQRFVDRRTAVLLKKLKDDEPLLAGISEDGEVIVEGQFVGRLLGFEFILDPRARGAAAKPIRAAAEKALRPELAARGSALANADADTLDLMPAGTITWRGSIVAHLEKGPGPFRPKLVMRNVDALTPVLRGRIEDRLTDYLANRMEALLAPLLAMQRACDQTPEQAGEDGLKPETRGIAWRLVENFGATSRGQFGDELKSLDQKERAKLRALGLRFGEYTLFLPALLKPAPAGLLTLLWALWHDKDVTKINPPKAGLVSTPVDETIPHAYYYASGYRPSGARAVRIDLLERLAGEIRTAREKSDRREGFEATPQMMSLVGCSGEDFEAILMSLNFRKNTVTRPAPQSAPTPAVPETQATPDATEPSTDPHTNQQDEDATPIAEAEAEAKTDAHDPAAQASPAPAPDIDPVMSKISDVMPKGDPPGANLVNPAPQTTMNEAEEKSDQAAEGGDASDTISVTLWRYQPKRAPQNRKPKRGDANTRNDTKRSRTGADGKPGGRQKAHADGRNRRKHSGNPQNRNGGPDKQRAGGKNQNPHMHKPRHLKTADPDSPFAVLAALKGSEEQANPAAQSGKATPAKPKTKAAPEPAKS